MQDLDDIDRAILGELRRDARVSMTAIAEVVHISRAGAHARIKRLTDAGVITGYTVRTDPVLLGHHASAYVMLALEQPAWQEVQERYSGCGFLHSSGWRRNTGKPYLLSNIALWTREVKWPAGRCTIWNTA